MKKAIVVIVCILALLFVSCDPELLKPQGGGTDQGSGDGGSGQEGGQGGSGQEGGQSGSGQSGSGGQGESGGQSGSQSGDTYTVTFIQDGLDNVVATYDSGEPLWVHAPDLPAHKNSGYFYNWDAELDAKVTSDMTVTRTEIKGKGIIFRILNEHTVKIVCSKTLAVKDFPATAEIEGYTGVWREYNDIDVGWHTTYTVLSWYYSNETYSSTGMPKTFILPDIQNGREEIALSEYPIHVSGTTLTEVNKTNFSSAATGRTAITSSECAAVVDKLGNTFKYTYAKYNFKEGTDYLVSNLSDLGFVNAIKVMRQKTGDSGWSIPHPYEMAFILKMLYEQGTEDTFYSYLYAGDSEVKTIVCSNYFVSYGKQRMDYSWISGAGEGVVSEYLFGNTFYGYLWPIKFIE